MIYNCEYCKYSTTEKQSWYYHKKSKKHTSIMLYIENNKKPQDEIIVQNDQRNTNTNGTTIMEKEHEIELLKQKINFIEKELEDKDKQLRDKDHQIQYLQMDNEYHKKIISSAGGLIEKSLNTFNYLLLNYNSAPHINKLEDYSIISQNNQQLIKSLIFYYNKKQLPKYIGDFIIKNYKKDRPELQSLWSSDVGRLNYIIKELIENNKKEFDSKWIIDKKGVKMSKYIIEPVLEYIKSINLGCLNRTDDNNIDNEKSPHNLKQLITIGSINSSINNGELLNEINKYIAPYFFLDKPGIVKK